MTDDRPAGEGRRAWLVLGAAACVLAAAFSASGADPTAVPAAATGPAATGPAREPTPAEVAALVKQLGDDRYQNREAAQKELIRRACPEVYQQVQQAAKSQDPETAQRAADILKGMGSLASEWAGRKVRQGLLWQRELKGGLCWPVVAVGGVVCLRGQDGTARGLDARTGKDLWAAPNAAAMAVDGKCVFLIDTDRKLVALDLATGKALAGFRPERNSGFVRLTAAGGTVYASRIDVSIPGLGPASAPAPAGAKDAKDAKEPPGPRAASALLALDGQTGTTKWTGLLRDVLSQDPTVSGGMVYVVLGAWIEGWEAGSGVRKWTGFHPLENGDGSWRCLGATGKKVYFSTGRLTMAYYAATGVALGGGDSGVSRLRPLAEGAYLVDGVLYTVEGDKFTAHDTDQGSRLWSYRPELKDEGPITAGQTGGTITINAGGTIVLNGGTLTVTVGPGGGGVAILNGKVVATADPHGGGLSLPTPLKDTIVFTTPHGLQAVRVLDWTVLWRLPEKGLLPYRPILADGVLYFAARAGGGPSGSPAPVILYALTLP